MASNSLLLSDLRATHRISGHATRSELWGFAPVGLSLCVFAALGASMRGFSFMGIVLTAFTAAVPLLALWWRSLQDVGVCVHHAVFPWVSHFAHFICASAAYALQNEAAAGFRQASGLLFNWTVVQKIMLKFVGSKWVATLIALTSLINFAFRFVFSLSHAMLPSDQKNHRYGPNPHEVPQ